MPLFAADNLFCLSDIGPTVGMPAWANLRAEPNSRRTAPPAAFTGPGLYAVLSDGYLIYIGLYAGPKADPFGGAVHDERWSKHIVGFTLRAHRLYFRRRPLQSILGIPGDPAEGLGLTLPKGRDTLIARTDPALCPPLKPRGIMSSYNKALFAAEHWDALRPGNEDAMLRRFTFEYQQIPAPEGARPDKPFVKYTWLAPREDALIRKLHPRCNRETDPATARRDVTLEEVREEMTRVLAGPLEPFVPDTRLAAVPTLSRGATASRSMPETADESENGGGRIGEKLFRQSLSAECENFVAKVMEDCKVMENCPDGFTAFFTDNIPELRVRLNAGKQRRLLVVTPSGRGFLCKTLASIEACRAIGLDAGPCPPGERVMAASFLLDPAVHRPATLFAVLGAATQSLM